MMSVTTGLFHTSHYHCLRFLIVAGRVGRYLYSRVFAEDMYATMFNADPLDPAKGKLYREKILRWGGSRDDAESLKVCLLTPYFLRSPDVNAGLLGAPA